MSYKLLWTLPGRFQTLLSKLPNLRPCLLGQQASKQLFLFPYCIWFLLPQTTSFFQNWSMHMLHDHLLHYLGCKLVTSLFMLKRLGHLLYRIIYLQGRHFFPSKSCMLKILCWTECHIGMQTKLWAMYGSSFTHTVGLWPWGSICASRFELYAVPLHCSWVLIVWGSVHSCQPVLQVWIIWSAIPLQMGRSCVLLFNPICLTKIYKFPFPFASIVGGIMWHPKPTYTHSRKNLHQTKLHGPKLL
jgi:hypothetical protein